MIRISMLVALMLVAAGVGGACSQDQPEADPTADATRVAAADTVIPPSDSSAAEICARAAHDIAGVAASPDLIEISGLAASRIQDVIWAHNDSGDTPRVFAMSLAGASLATYEVRGAEATDWEDMAIGPGPETGVDYLYLGDIGDNASLRPEVVVYRAPEPRYDMASSLNAIDAEALRFSYPDGPHDAETLLADPTTGDLYIITKDISGGPSGLYRAAAPHNVGGVTILEKGAIEIDFAALTPAREIPAGSGPLPEALGTVPTGGDVSPDGSMIAVRTYGTVWIWDRSEEGLAASFAEAPCEGPSEIEAQGEAIAFRSDNRGYFTASEGTNVTLHGFSLD